MISVVFPGQGSQFQGMLQDFYQQYPLVQQVFNEASDILDYDLYDVMQNQADNLNKTEYTQPALLVSSVAIWRVWQQIKPFEPDFLAGHSVGEYSALVCAEALSLVDALKLVRKRGMFMQEAVALGVGSMAAVLGLKTEVVESICSEISTDSDFVAIANYNSPGQIVIAGHAGALARAAELAKKHGAKRVVTLPVSVPAHCDLMKSAADRLLLELESISWNTPKYKVIQNFDVAIHSRGEHISQSLVSQICNSVRWIETIQKMLDNKVEKIIECGPGKVLTGLNRRIVGKIAKVSSTSDVDSLLEVTSSFSDSII